MLVGTTFSWRIVRMKHPRNASTAGRDPHSPHTLSLVLSSLCWPHKACQAGKPGSAAPTRSASCAHPPHSAPASTGRRQDGRGPEPGAGLTLSGLAPTCPVALVPETRPRAVGGAASRAGGLLVPPHCLAQAPALLFGMPRGRGAAGPITALASCSPPGPRLSPSSRRRGTWAPSRPLAFPAPHRIWGLPTTGHSSHTLSCPRPGCWPPLCLAGPSPCGSWETERPSPPGCPQGKGVHAAQRGSRTRSRPGQKHRIPREAHFAKHILSINRVPSRTWSPGCPLPPCRSSPHGLQSPERRLWKRGVPGTGHTCEQTQSQSRQACRCPTRCPDRPPAARPPGSYQPCRKGGGRYGAP